MDKVTKNERGLELVSSHSSGYKTNSEKILYLFYIIWLSLMIYWKAVFELFQKLYLLLCKSIHDIKLFHFYLSFWICKVWKGREKITKIWISWKQKELFRWNKNFFVVFKELLFEEKIKIWKKNSRHKL